MDNLNLFNNKAENYVKARPNYAKTLIEKLKTYNLNNESTVADIGCGTGIFPPIVRNRSKGLRC